MSNINLNDILKAFGIKDEFASKSKESIKKAEEGAWDKSIFDSKEAFVEHSNDEIFESFDAEETREISMDSFVSKAIENDFLDEAIADGFHAIIDRNNDGILDEEELTELISTAYDSATESVTETGSDQTTNPDPGSPDEPAPPKADDAPARKPDVAAPDEPAPPQALAEAQAAAKADNEPLIKPGGDDGKVPE